MSHALSTFVSDGYLVITVPETSVPKSEREDFVSAVRTEWLARQSQMTEADAKRLADQVDSGWWRANRARILASIDEA